MKSNVGVLLCIAVALVLAPLAFVTSADAAGVQPTLCIQDGSGYPGGTSDVSLELSGAEVASAMLTVTWGEGMELIDADSDFVFEYDVKDKVMTAALISGDLTARTGKLISLSFRIAGDASGSIEVRASADQLYASADSEGISVQDAVGAVKVTEAPAAGSSLRMIQAGELTDGSVGCSIVGTGLEVSTLKFDVTYDPDKLRFESFDSSPSMSDHVVACNDDGNGKATVVFVSTAGDVRIDGSIGVLHFTVRDLGAGQSTDLGLDVDGESTITADGTEVSIDASGTSLSQPSGGGDEDDGNGGNAVLYVAIGVIAVVLIGAGIFFYSRMV